MGKAGDLRLIPRCCSKCADYSTETSFATEMTNPTTVITNKDATNVAKATTVGTTNGRVEGPV